MLGKALHSTLFSALFYCAQYERCVIFSLIFPRLALDSSNSSCSAVPWLFCLLAFSCMASFPYPFGRFAPAIVLMRWGRFCARSGVLVSPLLITPADNQSKTCFENRNSCCSSAYISSALRMGSNFRCQNLAKVSPFIMCWFH